MYEAVANAVSYVRDCGGISSDWKNYVDEDYKNRK